MKRIFDHLNGEPEDRVFSRVARAMAELWHGYMPPMLHRRRPNGWPHEAPEPDPGQRQDCPDAYGEFEARR